MPALKISVIALSLALVASYANAQSAGAKTTLIHTVDSILQSQVSNDKIPGAVIEIKKGDEVIYKQAYGYAQKYDYDHRHPDSDPA